MNTNSTHAIAVIGMAGRFPGAQTVAEFWENICVGQESISRFSRNELLAAGVPDHIADDPAYIGARGILRDANTFDADFFGLSSHEAELMDPQLRLFMECCWQALEDGACDSHCFSGQIGVFGGKGVPSYLFQHAKLLADSQGQVAGYQFLLGNEKDHLATRVAYCLDLHGPAVTVQTTCSTSLVAIHLACQSLLSGDCDVALAGGVQIVFPQVQGYWFEHGAIGSGDGYVRAFSMHANGAVGGNGVGVVALRRLEDALHDGDPIRAVVLGSAINNDGRRKPGYTSPSVEGQAEVIQAALHVSQVTPDSIGYVETHGSATPLGDRIEIQALTEAYRNLGATKIGYCNLGSVKCNIGHLDTAAGVVGFMKAVLAVQHAQIPPMLHADTPNQAIEFSSSPFQLPTQLQKWPKTDYPRRAGVSSFGIGSTNVHVILEQSPEVQFPKRQEVVHVLPLSARNTHTLQIVKKALIRFCELNPAWDIARLARTLQAGRRHWDVRAVIEVGNIADAIDKLRLGVETECSNAIGRAWLSGENVNWDEAYEDPLPQKLSLPGYPFERQRYWFEPSQKIIKNGQSLLEVVLEQIQALIGKSSFSLTTQTDLVSLGLDSFLALTLLRNLQKVTGRTLTPEAYFGCLDIQSLVDVLSSAPTNESHSLENAATFRQITSKTDLEETYALLSGLPASDLTLLDPLCIKDTLALISFDTFEARWKNKELLLLGIEQFERSSQRANLVGLHFAAHHDKMRYVTKKGLHSIADVFEEYQVIAPKARRSILRPQFSTWVTSQEIEYEQYSKYRFCHTLSVRPEVWKTQCQALAHCLTSDPLQEKQLKGLLLARKPESATIIEAFWQNEALQQKLLRIMQSLSYAGVSGDTLLKISQMTPDEIQSVLQIIMRKTHWPLLVDTMAMLRQGHTTFVGMEIFWCEPLFVHKPGLRQGS